MFADLVLFQFSAIWGSLFWPMLILGSIPNATATVRRLHDTNRSAAWLVIGWIPFLGSLLLLPLLAREGTHGPNKYGEPVHSPRPTHEPVPADRSPLRKLPKSTDPEPVSMTREEPVAVAGSPELTLTDRAPVDDEPAHPPAHTEEPRSRKKEELTSQTWDWKKTGLWGMNPVLDKVMGVVVVGLLIFKFGPDVVSWFNGAGNGDGTTSASTHQPAEGAAKPAAGKAALDKSTYKQISDHGLKLLFKDPQAHAGDRYVLYGWVSQFDAATGTELFMAGLSPTAKVSAWEYTNPAAITLDSAKAAEDVVQGDLVTLYVEVEGTTEFDTQEGGHTVVPSLRAHIVEKTGHTET